MTAADPAGFLLNGEEARFDCIFGRGCEGICCRNGRPPVYPDERARIDGSLAAILPALRPEARALVEREGYLSRRVKAGGAPMLRVADGWCVFFHKGCVLHRAGEAEGDKFRYKPSACALFPLDRDRQGRWFVRQRGRPRERWDLFCLDPAASPLPAVASLQEEIALARRLSEEEEDDTPATHESGTP